MDGEKNRRYLEKALSGIPEDFSGKLLEVPVGTGVLTMPVYRELPDADITCLDYSENMMASAQKKATALGLANITFRQGDVGALPFEDGSFDIVLSLGQGGRLPRDLPGAEAGRNFLRLLLCTGRA